MYRDIHYRCEERAENGQILHLREIQGRADNLAFFSRFLGANIFNNIEQNPIHLGAK